ncbi:putative substrate-binding periplasmic abc transporter protein [Ralstonia solanacearum CFBP2957]|nr:putative substrate-binding periplasmic abc transporter protein [Ralstonia solanacearum CFBP2957]
MSARPVRADEPIRIGLIAPVSGFAEYGKQMASGIKADRKRTAPRPAGTAWRSSSRTPPAPRPGSPSTWRGSGR